MANWADENEMSEKDWWFGRVALNFEAALIALFVAGSWVFEIKKNRLLNQLIRNDRIRNVEFDQFIAICLIR